MNRKLPVTEIMTTDLITLHPEDSLNIVEQTFASKTFHHIPIVSADNEIMGMVSKTDLLQISAIRREFSEKDFKYIKVKDFMTREVYVAHPESTLEQVAAIFNENKFHAIPIVEGSKVIGIVTTQDVIRAAFELEPVS